MLHPPPRRPGRLAALPAQTFLSSLRAPCGVQQATSWSLMSNVESVMAVYGSSTPPAFATAVRVPCVSSANGTVGQRANRARSVSCSILCQWDRLRCSGETGVDGTSGWHVSVCIASTWTSRWNRLSPEPILLPLRRSLGLSVRIPACHGTSGWLATPAQIRLGGSRSPSSGFQIAWRPSLDWPPLNTPSACRDPSLSSDKRASPSGLSCLLFLVAPHIHAPFSRFPFSSLHFSSR